MQLAQRTNPLSPGLIRRRSIALPETSGLAKPQGCFRMEPRPAEDLTGRSEGP